MLRIPLSIHILFLGFAPCMSMAQQLQLRTTFWRPDGVVFAVAVDSVNNIAYLGGDFTQLTNPLPPFNTTARQRLAAIDLNTGAPTAWNPGADGQVLALAVNGNEVFVGGQQVQCGGASRPNLSVISRTTGLATNWVPQVANGYVRAFAVSNGTLYFTGQFLSVGGQQRLGAAAFDLTTTALTDWAPVANDLIRALVVQNGTVYMGGAFTEVNGVGRERAASVDAQFGQNSTWAPVVSGGIGVIAMARIGTTIYLGGDFSSINGQARAFAGAVTTGGSLTAWNPAPQNMVNGLCPFSGGVALSGAIGSYGSLNVVDPTAGAVVGWTGMTDQVFALVATASKLVAGGSFNAVNNYPVTKLAVFDPPAPNVALAISVRLDGPYDSGTGLMRDDLRSAGLLPYTEPYSALGYTYTGGGDQGVISTTLMNAAGSNALVDWVVVELRSSSNSAQVVSSRRALVRRSGSVVDLNGQQTLTIPAASGNYHVAIRHRNHLGVMSAAPIALSGTNTANVTFTFPSFVTYGAEARKQVGSTMVLWAGDVTGNGQIKYTGSGNDRDPILTAVGSTTPNATIAGYLRSDVNLDGLVKYTGSGNDRDPILLNVGSTTPNLVRLQQLP